MSTSYRSAIRRGFASPSSLRNRLWEYTDRDETQRALQSEDDPYVEGGAGLQKASQMASGRLRVRLQQREAVLRLLDRRRGQTGDPNLGSGMEKKILDLELADLETTMGIQESTERTVIRNI